MRSLTALTITALLTLACPAFAQSMNGGSNPTDAGMSENHRAGVGRTASVHGNYGRRQQALGPMHHPTVGHTANQRVNGG